jgi:cytochrome c-type biogenesis protein CcmH/NrfG
MNRRFRFRRRQAIALALSACVLTVAAPTAVAMPSQDLRSPDARDAALAAEQQAARYSDLRSPDARDAANGVTTGTEPAPTPAPVATRTVIAVEDHGSQTLAIVFSATALLIALLAVAIVAIGRRPRPRWSAP